MAKVDVQNSTADIRISICYVFCRGALPECKLKVTATKHVLLPQGWHWARLPPNCLAAAPLQPAIIAEGSDADAQHASSHPRLSDNQRMPGQVLLLCWTHAVIGFGFFGVPLVWQSIVVPWRVASDVPVCCLLPTVWCAAVTR